MYELNRSAVIVTPKQPFLDWLHFVDPTSSHIDLADLNLEPIIYLLPECETDVDFLLSLQGACPAIFEDTLNNWWTRQSDWPADRTWSTFRDWYSWQFHSLVMDLSNESLKRWI